MNSQQWIQFGPGIIEVNLKQLTVNGKKLPWKIIRHVLVHRDENLGGIEIKGKTCKYLYANTFIFFTPEQIMIERDNDGNL